jgi:hypothetical protein
LTGRARTEKIKRKKGGWDGMMIKWAGKKKRRGEERVGED